MNVNNHGLPVQSTWKIILTFNDYLVITLFLLFPCAVHPFRDLGKVTHDGKMKSRLSYS